MKGGLAWGTSLALWITGRAPSLTTDDVNVFEHKVPARYGLNPDGGGMRYVYAYIHTYTHVCILTRVLTLTYTRDEVRLCIHTYRHIHMYAYLCVYGHLHIHQ